MSRGRIRRLWRGGHGAADADAAVDERHAARRKRRGQGVRHPEVLLQRQGLLLGVVEAVGPADVRVDVEGPGRGEGERHAWWAEVAVHLAFRVGGGGGGVLGYVRMMMMVMLLLLLLLKVMVMVMVMVMAVGWQLQGRIPVPAVGGGGVGGPDAPLLLGHAVVRVLEDEVRAREADRVARFLRREAQRGLVPGAVARPVKVCQHLDVCRVLRYLIC